MCNSECFSSIRVLVELGKQNPDLVFPIFEEALLSRNITLFNLAMFELSELGKSKTREVISFFNKMLHKFHPYSLRYEPLRVLVEVGRKHPHKVATILKKALFSSKEEMLRGIVNELTILAEVHPDIFIPLLTEILDSYNPHIQWIAAFALLHLAKAHPQQVNVILDRHLKDKKIIFDEHNRHALSKEELDDCLKNYKKILQGEDEDKQWNLALKIAELAVSNAESVFPILKYSLNCQNLHVIWISIFVLIKLFWRQPETVFAVFDDIYKLHGNTERLLPQLQYPLSDSIQEIFSYALLCEDNFDLKVTAINELFETLVVRSNHPHYFISLMSEIFEEGALKRDDIKNKRLLVDMGKAKSQVATNILQYALSIASHSLRLAAEKELRFLVT